MVIMAMPRRLVCLIHKELHWTRQVYYNYNYNHRLRNSLILFLFYHSLHLGNVYIAQYNCRIRKVTVSTGIITTIAGGNDCSLFNYDYGEATSVYLYYPQGVALDSSGRTAHTNSYRIISL